MRSRITASRTALAMKCQYSFRKESAWLDTFGKAAEYGRIIHAAAEAILLGRPEDVMSLSSLPAEGQSRHQMLREWVRANKTNTMLSEVSYAFHPKTGVCRHTGSNRAYAGVRDDEIAGTVDAIDPSADPITIIDFKTGQYHPETAFPQLLTLAVLACGFYGVHSARLVVVHVDRVLTEHERIVDSVDLAAHAGLLAELHAKTPTSVPQPGPHCTEMYCQHLSYCPSTIENVAQLVPVEALMVKYKFSADIQSPEHAAFCLEKLEAIKRMTEQVESKLKEYATKTGGIVLAGGKIYKETQAQRTSTDIVAMERLARKLGASQNQIAETRRTTTYSSYRKVNR